MARIDFRKAFSGEAARQRVFAIARVETQDEPLSLPSAQDAPIPSVPLPSVSPLPGHEPPVFPPLVPLPGRPFWLRLLRSPLTAPRRFLVRALHVKIDGIIARQEAMQISMSALQQTVNTNQATVVALAATLSSIGDAVRAEIAAVGTNTQSGLKSLNASTQEGFESLNAYTQEGLKTINADTQTTFAATNAAIGNFQEMFLAGALADRLARLESLAVNRLHEIDIKIRGPHAFDDQTDAVRLNDGYVLVPKSAAKLRILLADAPADGLEPGTAKVIRRLLQTGMTAIDVGANVGALSLTCARAVGPTGKVFAFEPEPALAELLLKTFDLNGVPWVQLSRAAASRSAGMASFHVSPISGHSSLYPLPSDEQSLETLIEVETCTLDDTIDSNQTIDLVKMDVEGAELDVFAGMTAIVERNPELVIIAEFGASHLVKQGLNADDWIQQFRSAGFTLFAIDEMTGGCKLAAAADIVKMDSVNLVMAKPRSRAYRILAH